MFLKRPQIHGNILKCEVIGCNILMQISKFKYLHDVVADFNKAFHFHLCMVNLVRNIHFTDLVFTFLFQLQNYKQRATE